TRAPVASIAPVRATADPHLRVDGPAFGLLGGAIEIEPVNDTVSQIIATTDYRVSTHFNPYAGWWVDRLARSAQREWLAIVRARAEAARNAKAPYLTAEMRELEGVLVARAHQTIDSGRTAMLVDETAILKALGVVVLPGGVSIVGTATQEGV